MKQKESKWWSIKCETWRWRLNQVRHKSNSREGQPLKLSSIKMYCSHPKYSRNLAAPLFMVAHSKCKEGMRVLTHLSTIIIKNSHRMRKTISVAKLQLTNLNRNLHQRIIGHTRHPNSPQCKRTLLLSMTKFYQLKKQELVVIKLLSMHQARNLMKKKPWWVNRSPQIIWQLLNP